MEEKMVTADVLCVGGGIAGLMAAIRAAELGARVVVAEKGNALHSGRGRAGNDHFEAYIPDYHGIGLDTFIDELLRTAKGEHLLNRDIFRVQFGKAFDIVKLWDSWGIPMKYQGHWEFAGHSFPGHAMTHVKYEGQMQKKVLVKQALDRGVKIINRVMVVDLLRDGNNVIGAIGAHTREDQVTVFQAKATILGTGKCSRLYPSLTPGWMFNDANGGTLTGDGRAMAYRAGAKLQNVEMPERHIGPKYFTRFGQATWVGVLKDPQGKPVGTFVSHPDRKHGDMIMEVNKQIAEQYTRLGKGPLYMDCTGITNEDYDYMMHWMVHEGNNALLNYLKEEGIDIRKNPIEFATYPFRLGGQIVANEKSETSLKGLYAAGDEAFGDISAAATFGWISGDNAAKYAPEAAEFDMNSVRDEVEKKKQLIDQLRGREDGPDWEETNIALQQVRYDYAGTVRNEDLLQQGIKNLRAIKDKAFTAMIARNPHELGRCLEVLNLLDIGELVFLMARDRKETRGLHTRPDYPFTNPLLNKFHVVQKTDSGPEIYWQELGN